MALLAGARRDWRGEALKGVSLAAMSAPLAMAFAQFAGLPAAAGLYALIAPGALFALFAPSGRLTAAPDVAVIALVAATLTPLAHPATSRYLELAAAQALVAGGVFALLALLRLGVVAALLPRPALLGVTSAIALDLLARELAGMFGIPLGTRATDAAADGFLQHAGTLLAHLGDARLWAIVVAAFALLALVLGRRISRAFPWELAVVAVTIAGAEVFALSDKGVAVVGQVSTGRPPFAWPRLDGGGWLDVLPGAVLIALVALAQHLDGDRLRAPAGTRDGLGYGLANVVSGLGGGLALGPSPARRTRLDELRSSFQLPTLVTAALVLAAVLFGGDVLGRLPTPALGAIASVATWPLLRLPEVRALWRGAKREFLLAAVCFVAVLVLGVLWGLAVAAVLGALRLVRVAAAPPSDVVDAAGRPIANLRPGAPLARASAPGVVIVRFAAPVDTVSVGALARGIRNAVGAGGGGIRHLVLDCEAITGIDATGADVLRTVFAELARRGVTVDYARARAVLRVELERHGLLGGSRIFRTLPEALDGLGGADR